MTSDWQFSSLHGGRVFDFLINNEGAEVIIETTTPAFYRTVVRTGGLTPKQVRAHKILCIITLGLWFPMFFMISLLRAPREYHIDTDRTDGITTVVEF